MRWVAVTVLGGGNDSATLLLQVRPAFFFLWKVARIGSSRFLFDDVRGVRTLQRVNRLKLALYYSRSLKSELENFHGEPDKKRGCHEPKGMFV